MLFQFHTRLALRSLFAQKKFSFISILSLSLAFVSVLLITLWVKNELSYDRHFPKHEQIYRLTLKHSTPNGYESHFARVAQDWVLQVGDHIPEIENTVRFAPKRNALVQIGDHNFSTKKAFTCDTSVFDLFDLKIIEGDGIKSLDNPNCAILSETFTKKYFQGKSPIGEYINIFGQNEDAQRKYLVTGVFKDFPATTHFHPEILLSYDDPRQYGWSYFYLLLQKNTDLKYLQTKLDEYLKNKIDPDDAGEYSLHLQKITDIHLHSAKDREIELNGNVQAVYILAAIAIMILLIAIFNYINLNIAQLFKEIRFLVINKVYGASAKSIFQFQFIKSALIAIASIAISILLFVLAIPFLGQYFEITIISPDQFLTTSIILILLFLIAVVAGSLPAFQFIINRFHQHKVIRSNNLVRLFHPQKRFFLRKILIGIQITISISLIISTVFATIQLNFMSSKKMGNNPGEQVIAIQELGFPIRVKYDEFRTELLKSPYVMDVSATMELPPSPIKDAFGFEADCPVEEEDLIMYVGPVADNFFNFYKRPIIAGSDFPEYIKGQEFESYVLNETAVKFLGWEEPADAIGKYFKFHFMSEGFFFGGKIHGVVEDFHQTSLHHKIVPTVYFQQPAFLMSFLIKVKNEDIAPAFDYIEESWKTLFPEYPLVLTFQDNLYDAAYAKEKTQARLSGIFTILAIIITLIGLIGITAILTGQRTKEIGIRKVLGASFADILFKLSREIIYVLLISTGLAIVASLYLTGLWLQNYAYAILIENFWWVPAGIAACSFILILSVVLVTVYQTSQKNPTDSLRSE